MKKNRSQQGVVLIMSLLMLVLVSLLATTTMKSALSSEAVSAGVRQNQLAHQAAEMALRHCEDAVFNHANGIAALPSGLAVQDFSITPAWQAGATTWDQSNPAIYVLSLDEVNNNGAPYLRPPECLVEHLAAAGTPEHNTVFVVTARGFGPEVAKAGNSPDRRPKGSEVFLQSTLELVAVPPAPSGSN
ncbi:MAG: PilX N-terminal domain-containing pilus assembly protein [Ramlibacter sp.]